MAAWRPSRRCGRRRGRGVRGARPAGRGAAAGRSSASRRRRPSWPGPAGTTRRSTRWPTRCRSLAYELQDLGGELRAYQEGAGGGARRGWREVEERLDRLARLKRKHGGTIAAVLEHAERCRADRDRLANAEREARRRSRRSWPRARTARAAGARAHADARAGGARPGARRAGRARPSSRWTDAAFEVECRERASRAGEGAARPLRGAAAPTSVEFVIAPNRACPAGPLREVASGGELSRVMLALMSVTAAARARRRWCSTRSTRGSAARRRAASARSCASSRPARQVAVHHAPAPGGFTGRSATSGSPSASAEARCDGSAGAERARHHARRAARARRSSSTSCAGCWGPTPGTAPPADMPKTAESARRIAHPRGRAQAAGLRYPLSLVSRQSRLT